MQQAIDELILTHRDYVRKLAREIARKLPDHAIFDDLVGYGEIGLVEAANNFDPLSGTAFTTFSYYRIRGAIFDGIRAMTGITPALRKQMARDAGMDQVAQDSTVAPELANDPEANAAAMNTAIKRLAAVFLVSNTGDEDKTLEGVDENTPDQDAETKELVGKLSEVIESLPEDQATIIRLFYFEQQSMTDIGKKLGKNKATISRQHGKALEAMAAALGP